MIKNHRQAERYFRKLARLMNLSHWAITVDATIPATEGSSAEIGSVKGRAIAVIFLSPHFFGSTPEDQRHIAVHELVHVIFAPPDHVAVGAMDEGAYKAWEVGIEYSTVAVAALIAQSMPMP